MEEDKKLNRLQESRKKSIPDLVKKYQKLVDETFKVVTQPLPVFNDLTNDDGEVIRSSEEILFAFIDVRNKALDTANSILGKINMLELELHAPEILDKKEEKEEVKEEVGSKKSWTKTKASSGK